MCSAADNSNNPGLEYAVDVYLWKRQLQSKYYVFNPLSNQDAVTPRARASLIKWLAAVNRQFNFSLETFCLTVRLLDRFLSIQKIELDILQLTGITAFFLAAKQEEVDPPGISELNSICADAYETKQFRWMELIMLNILDFELLSPTSAFFLHFLVDFEYLTEAWPAEFSRALLEAALCEYEFSQATPSDLAQAAFEAVGERLLDPEIHGSEAAADAELIAGCMKRMQEVQQREPLPSLKTSTT